MAQGMILLFVIGRLDGGHRLCRRRRRRRRRRGRRGEGGRELEVGGCVLWMRCVMWLFSGCVCVRTCCKNIPSAPAKIT
jgi:hypothetical protein